MQLKEEEILVRHYQFIFIFLATANHSKNPSQSSKGSFQGKLFCSPDRKDPKGVLRSSLGEYGILRLDERSRKDSLPATSYTSLTHRANSKPSMITTTFSPSKTVEAIVTPRGLTRNSELFKSTEYYKSLELSNTKDILKSPSSNNQKKSQQSKMQKYRGSKVPESFHINLFDKTIEKKPAVDETASKAETYLKEMDEIYTQLTNCIKEKQKDIFSDDNIAIYLNNLKAFAKGTYTLLKDYKGPN
jgi:hypothetical protein